MPPEEYLSYQVPKPKKSHIKLLLIPFLLIVVVSLSGLYFFKDQPSELVIPVEELEMPRVKSSYTWRPNLAVLIPSIHPKPDVFAKSALAMNLHSDDVYFVKNPTEKLPMASISKIMTAILVLENKKLDDVFTISPYADSIGENSMAIAIGEKYTVEELLWGLFLHSGNDAAEAIAENTTGSREKFIALMNQRAQELGAENTKFANPSGLEGDGPMYTTVEDLAILSKYLVNKFPLVLNMTRTLNKTLPANANHREINLVGEIDLIRTYPGALGLKTGFTDEAGRCIITIAENDGEMVMVIILGSQDRRVDAVKLLDYSYGTLGIPTPHEPFW